MEKCSVCFNEYIIDGINMTLNNYKLIGIKFI